MVEAICDKMIRRRHPHVFADARYATSEELRTAWERQKARERSTRGLLDDLRALAGPDVVLLANDNSTFVPLWGENSEMWNAYRAAMDPARYGLPDSAWLLSSLWCGGVRARSTCPHWLPSS